MVPVYALQKHLFGVLVGDVADHDGCARVFSPKDSVQVHPKMRVRQFVVRLAGHCGAQMGRRRGSRWVERGASRLDHARMGGFTLHVVGILTEGVPHAARQVVWTVWEALGELD